jgi:hypothetical protein
MDPLDHTAVLHVQTGHDANRVLHGDFSFPNRFLPEEKIMAQAG